MPLSLKLTKENKYSLQVTHVESGERCVVQLGTHDENTVQLILHDKPHSFRFDRVYMGANKEAYEISEVTRKKAREAIKLLEERRLELRLEVRDKYPAGYTPRELSNKIGSLTRKINKIRGMIGELDNV